jgi:dethiobiotin synthetase
MRPVFITGIGTDVGKTLVSAIVVKALNAAYWKPIQAGGLEYTDSDFVNSMTGGVRTMHPEAYRLQMAASPHTAAKAENITIEPAWLKERFESLRQEGSLVIEGAGGLLVPINNEQFVADMVSLFDARVILVSRGYLGSINHSLLTAEFCKGRNLDVAGWIFTDENRGYEKEISGWTKLPVIATIPRLERVDPETISALADKIREPLINALN